MTTASAGSTGSTPAGWPTFGSLSASAYCGGWTDGCAAACGRCAGRNGRPTAAKRHNLRIRGIPESEARKWAGVSRRYWRVAGSQILQVSLPGSFPAPYSISNYS